jgi:predicted TIM-barrel fold metal-dependent hydrolase
LNGAGPRRRAVALRLTDSSCRVIFGPRPARYAARADKENIMLDLVDPTIATARENIDYAARPTNLRGLRIGLIENTKKNAEEVLRKVAEKLRDNHGMTVEVMVHKAQRAPLKDAQIAEFKGKVDFVVSGVGD